MIKILMLGLLLFLLPLTAGAHELPPGNATVEAEFISDWLTQRPQKGMTVAPDGLSKIYAYSSGVSTRAAARNDHGQVLLLTAAARPNDAFYTDGTMSYLGNYADRFWRPLNDLHRQEASDERLRFIKGEAGFRTPSAALRLFQGKIYEEWFERGDLFKILPGQYELDRYLNFSGHAVPRAAEGRSNTPVGELGFIAGPEVVWGSNDSYYLRYNLTRKAVTYALIYKDEKPPFSNEEHRKAAEASLSTNLYGKMGLKLGAIYQPYRIDKPFVRAEKSVPGQGSFGSNYHLTNDVTTRGDAWGAALRTIYYPKPFLDQFELNYTYLGPVAGNKQEVNAGLSKLITAFLTSGISYTRRKPIHGPVPFLYQGTQDNPGALVSVPRGPEDPFWVDWDNREAHLFSWTFTQDPTPNSWLFRWNPDILESYNVNDKEDSRWAFSL
ncbi:MAG: hypothetical protein HY548_08685, partial [Elusimicrobia bacterium]|nr:hypothetical protein [Elusimicrobiota bacterium]